MACKPLEAINGPGLEAVTTASRVHPPTPAQDQRCLTSLILGKSCAAAAAGRGLALGEAHHPCHRTLVWGRGRERTRPLSSRTVNCILVFPVSLPLVWRPLRGRELKQMPKAREAARRQTGASPPFRHSPRSGMKQPRCSL